MLYNDKNVLNAIPTRLIRPKVDNISVTKKNKDYA